MSETKATKAFQAWLKSSIDHAQNGNEPSRWAAWEAGASWAIEQAALKAATFKSPEIISLLSMAGEMTDDEKVTIALVAEGIERAIRSLSPSKEQPK